MWLLAETQKSNLLFLLGVILACAVMLVRTLRRIRQAERRNDLPASSPAPGSASLQAAAEFQRWEVQMHETAREITARIDNKLRLLEQLIRDADQRIARLEALDEWMDQSGTAEDDPAVALAKFSQGAPAPPSPGTSDEAPAADSAPRPAKAPTASRRTEEVYALADDGHSSAEIANRLSSPVGEVELILGLRRQQRS